MADANKTTIFTTEKALARLRESVHAKATKEQLGGQVLQYDKPTDKSGSWHDLFAWSSPTRFTI
jgi:hypothetical protein